MGEIYIEFKARLDQILCKELGISRSKAANLIKTRRVFLGKDVVIKPSFEPNLGDIVRVEFDELEESKILERGEFDIEVIYEDSDILVINKPSNLAVHGAKSLKEYSLVEFLKERNFTLSNLVEDREGIVHRLDKGTSGVLVVAKSNKAHINLAKQFKDRVTDKYYLMLTDLPLKESIIIDRPIARNPKNRLKNAVVYGGKEAKSAFTNIYTNSRLNLVAAKIYTGRTHQIRVHLNSINRQILGDDLYGFKRNFATIKTLMLHSYILSFNHPSSGERVSFTANIKGEFRSMLDKENIDEKISPNLVISSFESLHSWVCYN